MAVARLSAAAKPDMMKMLDEGLVARGRPKFEDLTPAEQEDLMRQPLGPAGDDDAE